MVESAAGVEGVACTLLKSPAATARPPLNCAPLTDDGQVEIALMATEHPAITEFGKTAFEHMKEANALLTTCAPWQELGDFPPGALDTYRSAKAFAASLLKQLEQLDSIDLDDLKPDWGDKETVRMARRSAIAFAQQILDRLDGIQALLAAAAEKIRQERACSAQPGEAEVSLQDKYRDMFLANASSALPAAKRRRTQPATKAEVEALLKRIRSKTKQEILRQPNKAYYRRLVSLANVGELPQTPALCKEAVECMVSAAVCAVESAPSGKVLGKLFHSLQQLQELSPTASWMN
ncbi:CLK1 [Symbiodinium sp. CCMP2456]|nr:CLK1 [Symbiodinium sp. CCMP2456]